MSELMMVLEFVLCGAAMIFAVTGQKGWAPTRVPVRIRPRLKPAPRANDDLLG